jgi:virulence-associated protein VapD
LTARQVLARPGFNRHQGSVYFGDHTVDPVRCVLAVQDVARDCSWFCHVIRDVRMLRIEENNDLLPAIEGG